MNKKIAIELIRTDGGTPSRGRPLNQSTIDEYAESIEAGKRRVARRDPVSRRPEAYWLADGFHRLASQHAKAGKKTIPAEVRQGTRREAILHSVGRANANHGLRRTNADKLPGRRETLLVDAEWRMCSRIQKFAKTCSVGRQFVASIRRQQQSDFTCHPST